MGVLRANISATGIVTPTDPEDPQDPTPGPGDATLNTPGNSSSGGGCFVSDL